MTCFRLSPAFASLAMAAAVVAALPGQTAAAESPAAVRVRTFEFTDQVHVPANPDPGPTTHLRLPLPQPDRYQEIRGLYIESPVGYTEGHDPEYGNPFAVFTPTPQQRPQ